MKTPSVDRILSELRAAERQVGKVLLRLHWSPGDLTLREQLERCLQLCEQKLGLLENSLAL